ncbi:TetR/AcrR family transcriptional regulator [Rhodoblastus acidophilus]|uniref:TetR/AcrR family transcriptional regulator n=1 Tax=Candidatus Rhodoblastus alkanivorans TaxID=2954117 RepID=A0ABS9Z4P2_9HYPH|nr:TetR/AcrR family transcriptional regulator [Candidatus Rhodoblastus alkanivorans]MCI4677624.1 TetR/AcrR family transcriptional regulator [Candidatus Rhodoblastus alkanivorans]MCI4682644.1 TetR/AcrR family transcriptional regulator [Candidatus Rhodoblastus alkanivorans]MDI4639950.1 TetR/AcrR family transcriptional regulator [Rhodoblastus acidophilus]
MGAEGGFCGRRAEKGRGYHHGKLRQALLAAARALISERGPAGFTLAEAAKRVGVTGAAPYRHFADRNALIAELAQQGFEHFNEQLGRAWDGGRPDAVSALRRRGAAYLAFAKAEPGLYKAMFGDAGALARQGGDRAGQRAFDDLLRTTVAVLRQFHAPEHGARVLALEIWATTHGIADLMFAGHFGETPDQALALLEDSVAALVEAAVRKALGVSSILPPRG